MIPRFDRDDDIVKYEFLGGQWDLTGRVRKEKVWGGNMFSIHYMLV